MAFLLQGRFPQRLRTLVLAGSGEALFSRSEVHSLRCIFQDWLTTQSPGTDISWEVFPGQPYCLQALHVVSRICQDRDVSLFPCLQQGVPTGFDGDIPLSNVFLPQGGGHPFEQSLGICHGNWSYAEADLPTLHALVEEEVANGWLLELDSLEAAQERFGDKLAIGKMSIVKAERKKPRLVVDSTVCGTNPSCTIPETYTLPGVDDVRESFPLRLHSGMCAGFAFDIKSAHKTVRVRDSDQGLLGVSLPKIQGSGRRWLFYRVCPFGANFSAPWFQRLGSFFSPHFAFVDMAPSRPAGLRGQSMLRALQRNFGGLTKEEFMALCTVFLTGGRIAELEVNWFRTTLAVLQEALLDLPERDLPERDLKDANYEPCRYKLIIDETEDGGAVRVLQSAGLFPAQVPVLEVSRLPGDQSDLHRSPVVSDIRRAAERPGMCVMVDFDEILDGFYDLLNLRFQRIHANGRVGFAATVAAGSYSVLAPVDRRFQLVVCIRAKDLALTPLPFLNRFDKFYLGPGDLAIHTADILCHRQIQQHFLRDYLLQPVRQRLQASVQLLGPASLIGFDAATMDSANEAMQTSRCQMPLQLLSAGWEERTEGAAEETEKPISREGPLDIGQARPERAEITDQADPVCFGHENAGNTCFLQASVVLICVHERHLLPPEHEAEPVFLTDLRHLLRKSRRQCAET